MHQSNVELLQHLCRCWLDRDYRVSEDIDESVAITPTVHFDVTWLTRSASATYVVPSFPRSWLNRCSVRSVCERGWKRRDGMRLFYFFTVMICCLRSSFYFLHPLFAWSSLVYIPSSSPLFRLSPCNVIIATRGCSIFYCSSLSSPLIYRQSESIIEMVVIQEIVLTDERSVEGGWIFSISYADRERSEYPLFGSLSHL